MANNVYSTIKIEKVITMNQKEIHKNLCRLEKPSDETEIAELQIFSRLIEEIVDNEFMEDLGWS